MIEGGSIESVGCCRAAARAIRVNSICSGSIPTEGMTMNLHPEEINVRLARTPMRRIGKVPDIVSAAMYLACSESSFLKGTSIPVDAGVTHVLL